MSAKGRPERELLPLGGTARSAKGAPVSAKGRPERELLPLGGTARSAKGAPVSAKGRPERELLTLGGTARSAKGAPGIRVAVRDRGGAARAARAAVAPPVARRAVAKAAPDPESRLHDDHHASLRLWLRLLTCTLLVERRIRGRLREEFATTLPRFDLMAQLERNPAGLRMGELSQRLMVTGGNVTGITDQLAAEGLVERWPIPRDRRAHAVRLTAKGKRAFDTMAAAHERWVIDLFAGLDAGERKRLHALLGRVKTTLPVRDGATNDAAKEHRQ